MAMPGLSCREGTKGEGLAQVHREAVCFGPGPLQVTLGSW